MIAGFAGAEGLMTAEELLRLDVRHKSTELVRGRLVVREPPSTYHGRVQSNLNFRVAGFVPAHRLGAAQPSACASCQGILPGPLARTTRTAHPSYEPFDRLPRPHHTLSGARCGWCAIR